MLLLPAVGLNLINKGSNQCAANVTADISIPYFIDVLFAFVEQVLSDNQMHMNTNELLISP